MACRVCAGKDKDATVIRATSVAITLLSECEHNRQRARCDLRARSGDHRLKYHQVNRSLTQLNLGVNRIGNEGASALAQGLKARLVMRKACFSPQVRW